MMGKFDDVAEVEVEIDNVTFTKNYIEERKDDYAKQHHTLDGFEEWLVDQLDQVAWDRVLNNQGHNDLHHSISVGEVDVDEEVLEG